MTSPSMPPFPSVQALAASSGGLSHGAAVLIVAVSALMLLLVQLGTGDSVDMMELFNLVPVREACRDGHWLMPTLNGVARLEKPPLPVWMIGGMGRLFASESLWVLRLASVGMGILTALAIYALGCTLFRDSQESPGAARKLALLGAVFVPTMLVFNRQARLATYDIFSAGFLTWGAVLLVMLAEGGAADREKKIPRGRGRWWGLTLLAGIAVGLSILSKGPVPVAVVMLPLGLWLMIFHRRRDMWVAVGVAAAVSALVFVPWLVAIGGIPGLIPGRVGYAWQIWKSEMVQFGTGHSVNPAQSVADLQKDWFYYFLFPFWAAPVTPLVVAGLWLPLLRFRGGAVAQPAQRRGRWLLWLVVVGGLVMLSVFSEKKPRYALQIFPFAALLSAAVWQELSAVAPRRREAAGAAITLGAQALFFIVPAVAALGAVVWLTFTGGRAAAWAGGERTTALFEAVGPIGRFMAAVLFLVLVALGVRLWRQFRAGVAGPIWSLAAAVFVFTFSAQWIYKGAPWNHTNAARVPAESAAAAVGKAAVFTFLGSDSRPWLSTLYYFNRPIPQLSAEQIAAEAARTPNSPIFLFSIIASGGKPIESVPAQFAEVLRLTHRTPKVVLALTDEDRATALIRLDATQ